jgi:response regulator RpfG family c-di-GMP phosphodiesterase
MPNEKPKALIVDDRPQNLYALKTILQDLEGVEIYEALDGNTALELCLEHDFFVAMLDVQMPEMDGYELAQYLRSVEDTKYVPIIFLSAVYSDEHHIFKGYDSGAVDFIVKPFNPKVVLDKVRVFLELYRHRQELKRMVVELENTNVKLKMYEGMMMTIRNLEDQINNPLAIISMCAELIKEDPSILDKHIDTIIENTKRISRHIESLKGLKEVEYRETPIGPMLSTTTK